MHQIINNQQLRSIISPISSFCHHFIGMLAWENLHISYRKYRIISILGIFDCCFQSITKIRSTVILILQLTISGKTQKHVFFKVCVAKLQYFSLCHDGFLSDRKVRKNFAVGKFTRHINRVTSFNIKVCNLTSCCGLQVQNPIQAIKLFIGPK
jgi:hypothetical protein